MATKTSEAWVIAWFPPEADRTRSFRSEQAAREFAATEEVATWNPLMEHQHVTTRVVTTIIPLGTETGADRG